ncbi:MAG: ATP-dependent helicase RhlE, partial [Thermoleophilaceae bacterium]|nr:ATP-dependent helicase RhlE [Thermoleophilaceae bacterium]
VINFDPPEDREGYVHRTGRTGRAGRTGHAVTFVGGEQAADVGKIASELRLHEEFAKAGLGHAGRSHGRQEARGGGSGGGGSRSGGGGGGRNRRQRPRSSSGTGSTAGSGRGSRSNGGGSRSGTSNSSSSRPVASARPSRRSGRR